MITVGFDFGTHQTKICYENVQAGTVFYNVFRFKGVNGEDMPTLPSFIRLRPDGTLRYGHEAMFDNAGGRAITYFKQVLFSWNADRVSRVEAEQWSVLYLAYAIFKLDECFKGARYIIQMGMPTDAEFLHYTYCKRQAIKVMAAAMLLARKAFKGDLETFLQTPYSQLTGMVMKCMSLVPDTIKEARKIFPILVFPEAYAALIPLINAHKLPKIGANLFVDIGGGTVDISFFTSQMDETIGKNRPYLYYYHSVPYGLNMITGQDIRNSHNVEIAEGQITRPCIDRFRLKLTSAINEMMDILKKQYVSMGKTDVMPFSNLCAQILEGRPICYSGGGSMFHGLKLPIAQTHNGIRYNFSQVRTVSELIDHSKLYGKGMFHVLATAFALSHQSLISGKNNQEPDAIKLVSIDKLFSGIRLPQVTLSAKARGWAKPKNYNW